MISRRHTRPTAGADVRRSPFARAWAVVSRRANAPQWRPTNRAERLEPRTLLAADVVISEFMASNDKSIVDSYAQHSDWIEIHNRGDAAQNLDSYFLTDNGNDLTQWRFPAVTLAPGGYMTVFASGRGDAVAGAELHTNFSLSASGEYLALVRPDGITVQQEYAPSYPNQTTDVSYGLSFDNQVGNFEQQFFTKPTPGAANAPNVPEPSFSVPTKTFTGTLSVALSDLLPGAEIRYTTNRSAPTATSTLYTGPLSLTNTTMIRAQAFASGRPASPVVSQTYFALDASVSSFNSNLPVVIIDTNGVSTDSMSDTTLSPVTAYFIDTSAADGRAHMLDAPDFAGRAGMRLRGQTSQGFPKKPFAFETWDEANNDKNVSILGMPKESDWILMDPYSEKTLMQNALAYEWANRMGDYAVRTRYVEVFTNQTSTTTAAGKVDYNGDYQGIYLFMEKIKVDNDRVDIAKLGPADNTAPNVTGGYIWKKDKFDAGEVGFTAGGQTYQYFEPSEKDITPAQKTYLSNYINEFVSVLNGPNFADPVNGYAKYIDVDSWIDQHILVELTKNIDGFRLSTYYSKDRNGKIKMGPAWDYNLSLGNANYNNGQDPTGWYHDILSDTDYPYWRRLFQDPNFQQKYIDRWQELRKNELSTNQLMADIDSLTNLLSDGNGNYPVGHNPVQTPTNPVVRNFTKWQILGDATWPNYYLDPSWINQVNWMKDWLTQRVNWWDSQYKAMPTITPAGGPVSAPTQVTISAPGGQTFTDTSILPPNSPAKALVPTADLATDWRVRTGFDDSGWLSGNTGVGYDLNPSPVDYNPYIGLPVAMQNTATSVYVRVPFNVTNAAALQSLVLRMQYDDGFVAYLNGTEVARSSTAPATLAWNSTATALHDDSASVIPEEFDISQFKNLLVNGTNVLAIQGLNANLGSSDLLMMPELVSRVASATGIPVYYTTDGSDPRLPGGGINPVAQLYTGAFTVSSTAGVLARSKSGNAWSGLARAVYDFGDNRLRLSEIMYNPAPPPPGSAYLPNDFEYVELVNTGTQAINLNRSQFDRGITFTFGDYTLQPGARVLLVKNQAAFESRYGTGKPIAGTYTGSLSDGGEEVRLLGRFGEVIHDFTYSDGWYPQTDGDGWSLTVVDPNAPLAAWNSKAGWRASEPLFGTPGTTDTGLAPNSVVINEVVSNPTSGGDWIELRNTTGAAISLANYFLSDTAGDLKKWRIPAGTTIPANGYLVFTESQFGSAFTLAASGEGVYLSSGDASGNIGGYRVDETFGASDPGASFGRVGPLSTGGFDFTQLKTATKGGENDEPLIGTVVINEIMYAPAGGKSEYIELHNITGAPVNLYDTAHPADTWKISGGIDWTFPTGVSIPADGYVVVSAVDPAVFRTQYNVPADVQVFGPYTLANGTNVLSNDGESVRLLRPALSTSTPRQYVSVDRVAYDDEAPWPGETKGTGQALERIDSTKYGNDPGNWRAGAFGGSPGRPNLDVSPPAADVVDVTPDPHDGPIASITVTFTEPVTGVDLTDLRLTRNGSIVPLAAPQTVTTGDGGLTWVLGNLTTLTGAGGTYVLTLVAAGSGITDRGGRALAADASDTWLTNPDTSIPSATITAVAPDPRTTAVGTITIVFSEPVVGVDRTDFTLSRNGGPDMLTASQTVASTNGGTTWTLSGLTSITGPDGTYVLTLKSTGTGIADLGGNALAGGAVEQWLTDATRPTAGIVPVAPDPRAAPVPSISINFSEKVTGFDLADLRLTRDGGANLLSAAQTLTTSDGGVTWVLGNLLGVTAAGGNYSLKLVTTGSGIADVAGNTLSNSDPTITWSVDAVPPTADVVDVSPDPRTTAVGSITITFSEPVVGFDSGDLQLIRDGAGANLITSVQTLTTSDGVTWVLGNLAGATAASGSYTLTLVSGVSGITDAAGNSFQADVSDTWVVDATAPTATITAVAPDPRTTSVDSITVTFSEPVTGLDVSDLSLTRNGGANLLTAANTVGSADGGITWTIGGLSGLTDAQGTYVITLANSGTGIADALGNPMASGAAESWQVVAAPAPLITEVYVRGSTWAGADADPANVTFKEYLKAQGLGDDVYGFRVDGLPAGTTLPWINANQIVLRYSLPLTSQGVPSPASISLDGQLSDYAVNAVEQLDGQTVVLTLDRPLGAQPAGSADPTMGDRIRLSVPNAGPAGATYGLDLNALQGDVDRAANARVTAIDLGFVKARSNRTASEASAAGATYTAFADVNGDGRINAVDLGAVKARVNDFLPAPLAPAGAAITADSMTKDLFGTTPIL